MSTCPQCGVAYEPGESQCAKGHDLSAVPIPVEEEVALIPGPSAALAPPAPAASPGVSSYVETSAFEEFPALAPVPLAVAAEPAAVPESSPVTAPTAAERALAAAPPPEGTCLECGGDMVHRECLVCAAVQGKETLVIEDRKCMHRGDPFCLIVLRNTSIARLSRSRGLI